MLAGCAGMPGATDLHRGTVFTPQMLVAVTHTLADGTLAPYVTLMLLVDDVPVAPAGNVQL
jgi:hypothetical protein